MNNGLIVALIIAVIGPLFAYLAAARKLSGKIETSEAADLWEEAARLRQEYKDEIRELREQLDNCSNEIKKMKEENKMLLGEVNRLKDAI